MTYATIYQSTKDAHLTERVTAAIAKEAWANEGLGASPAGQRVRFNGPEDILGFILWPACVDFETAYSYAVDQANPDPGGDPGVITDAMIAAAVQVHWPDLAYTIRSSPPP
jgi:hypothetical protein